MGAAGEVIVDVIRGERISDVETSASRSPSGRGFRQDYSGTERVNCIFQENQRSGQLGP
jgi:hypothetical protein